MASSSLCPKCQASTPEGGRCWLCDAEVPIMAHLSPPNPYAPPPLPPPPVDIDSSKEASAITVAMIVGLVVVMLSMFAVSPGLAMMLCILSTPALVRTAVVVLRKRREGKQVSAGEQSMLFFASIAGVIAAATAAVGAFFIACSAVCFGALAMESSGTRIDGFRFEFVLVVVVGFSLLVGAWVLFRLWRKGR